MFKNVRFSSASGKATAISSNDPVHFIGENLEFDNIETPFDLAPGSTADIRGTRITRDPKIPRDPKTGPLTKRVSRGWTGALEKGPPLPSFCPSCKATFASRNYRFSGAYFNLWGNEDTCAQCGFEHAKLAEGIFDLTAATAKALTAPDITHAMLAAIARIAQDTISGDLSAEDAQQRLQAIYPQLASVWARATELGSTVSTWVIIGISVLALYLQYEGNRLQSEGINSSNAATELILEALKDVKIAVQRASSVDTRAPAKVKDDDHDQLARLPRPRPRSDSR